ncbi:immunoglobulin superfamily member 5 isoform X3 [Pristis pectinata]|uniref:immunoglobulin superfamily member 5 isoform X3 n=1 Tax=Pristis pectinata TaxID=685728 RepID=UPI00223CFB9E|nr:immunoglobulin superfamily member 5 isoform X3 [Pristis pectinata]
MTTWVSSWCSSLLPHPKDVWVGGLIGFTCSSCVGVCLSTKIIEVPKNAFALLHADAAFNCTVSLPWRIIIWLMDTIPILTIVPDGPIITDSRFHQRNYTTKRTFTSELIISPVTMRENMTVRCSLQTEEYQQAFLFVQVDGPLFFVKEISSVVENRATDIVCKAEGWNPVPTIRWKKNRTVVDSKMYTTTIEQSSDNLYNTISTLNLTLSANAEIMCLADIEALPQPKTAALFITVKSQTSYRNELKRMSTKKPFKITTDGVENLGMSTGSVNDLQRSPSLTSPYWINTWSGEKNNDTVEAPTIPAVDYGIQKETPNQPMDFSSSPRKTRHVTAV